MDLTPLSSKAFTIRDSLQRLLFAASHRLTPKHGRSSELTFWSNCSWWDSFQEKNTSALPHLLATFLSTKKTESHVFSSACPCSSPAFTLVSTMAVLFTTTLASCFLQWTFFPLFLLACCTSKAERFPPALTVVSLATLFSTIIGALNFTPAFSAGTSNSSQTADLAWCTGLLALFPTLSPSMRGLVTSVTLS